MANASYTAFKNGLMLAQYNLTTASIKVAVVRGYTFSAAHVFMSDVTTAGGTVHATSGVLANPTLTGGVFDADDVSITTTANASSHVLIVYQASAVTGGADVAASAQRLMFYFDTGTGLPITPAAGALAITWPSGTSKIYQLG